MCLSRPGTALTGGIETTGNSAVRPTSTGSDRVRAFDRPAISDAQKASHPTPIPLTGPTPVTTTSRGLTFIQRFSSGGQDDAAVVPAEPGRVVQHVSHPRWPRSALDRVQSARLEHLIEMPRRNQRPAFEAKHAAPRRF